jgi:hypothetical protein
MVNAVHLLGSQPLPDSLQARERNAAGYEETVREVLLRALKASGLDPQDGWVSVRAVNSPWPLQRSYTVVIAYQPARAALAGMLRRNTGGAEKESVGVWVLNESEARQLCGGACDAA